MYIPQNNVFLQWRLIVGFDEYLFLIPLIVVVFSFALKVPFFGINAFFFAAAAACLAYKIIIMI